MDSSPCDSSELLERTWHAREERVFQLRAIPEEFELSRSADSDLPLHPLSRLRGERQVQRGQQ